MGKGKQNMSRLHIDFETYSEAPIKTTGLHRYVADDSFEILCMAWAIDDDKPQLWLPGDPVHPELHACLTDGITRIYAYNAQFEKAVFDKCYEQFYLTRPIPVGRFRDTQALVASYSLPLTLEKAAEALGLPADQQKDKRGKYLINKLCKPKKWSNATPFTRWTLELAPGDFLDLYEYCKQDVVTERAVLLALPRLELLPLEQLVWEHTVKQNDRGLFIDYELVESVNLILEQYKEEQEELLSDLTDGAITTGNQRDRIIAFCQANGLKITSLTAETVRKAIAWEHTPDIVRKVLLIRQNLSKTSTAKFKKIVQMICPDNTVKGNLFYWGAITGRYGGRGFQMHNLPRRKEEDPTELIEAFKTNCLSEVKKFGDNVMENASKLVRSCIVPPPGYKLIVADYSSIENRALHACAYDWKTVKDFRENMDQYKTFASVKFRVPYDQVNDEQRFHGKVAILGLGYMMGGKTYEAEMKRWGLDPRPGEAAADVKLYRQTYPLVVKLWFDLYKAAMYTVRTGRVGEYNGIKFGIVKDRLMMKLPSQRMICYTSPRIEKRRMSWGEMKDVITFMGVNPYNKKWQRLQITPGRLTENLIQGLCRDILVQGCINAEGWGITVVGSVHDEILGYIPETSITDETLPKFEQLICDMPKWAEHIPLAAKGYIADRYKKD